jgi:hypothetical protein
MINNKCIEQILLYEISLKSVKEFETCSPKEKDHLGRPRRRWEDVMKMELGEIGWGGVEWIPLA